MSGTLREPTLSNDAFNAHRALSSLQEELEAVDYYNQRADQTEDPELEALLIHNRDEEVEHASMLLEYMRRTMPIFDEQLKTYLFKDAPITQIEELESGEGESDQESNGYTNTSLGIGSLK